MSLPINGSVGVPAHQHLYARSVQVSRAGLSSAIGSDLLSRARDMVIRELSKQMAAMGMPVGEHQIEVRLEEDVMRDLVRVSAMVAMPALRPVEYIQVGIDLACGEHKTPVVAIVADAKPSPGMKEVLRVKRNIILGRQ